MFSAIDRGSNGNTTAFSDEKTSGVSTECRPGMVRFTLEIRSARKAWGRSARLNIGIGLRETNYRNETRVMLPKDRELGNKQSHSKNVNMLLSFNGASAKGSNLVNECK
jgi:hypothetical protein